MLSENTTAELEQIRLRMLDMLAPLAGEQASPGRQSAQELALRQSLWSAAHALDQVLREVHMPVALDLNREDEATRQALHDFVVWDYFSPRTLEDDGDINVPGNTPEECGLRVFFEYGRWFVTWVNLEVDRGQPEAIRRELLVFEKNENGELFLTEV